MGLKDVGEPSVININTQNRKTTIIIDGVDMSHYLTGARFDVKAGKEIEFELYNKNPNATQKEPIGTMGIHTIPKLEHGEFLESVEAPINTIKKINYMEIGIQSPPYIL